MYLVDGLSLTSEPFGTRKKYIVSFVDDYSRYAFVYAIKPKNEVEKFELYVSEMRKVLSGNEYKIGVLMRCDNGSNCLNCNNNNC
jgi:hypothetical protein